MKSTNSRARCPHRAEKRILSIILSLVMLTTLTLGLDFSAKAETNPTDIVDISAGNCMSSAVRADGSVWNWGATFYAGLCIGNTPSTFPRMIISKGSASSAAGVFSDYYYGSGWGGYTERNNYNGYTNSAILKKDNSLWMWGNNYYRSIGYGTGSSNKPTKVLDNVVNYDTSGRHSAAVTSDGSLYMWGRNDHGQLSDVSTNSYEATPIKTSLNNVKSVVLGLEHSAAITTDGSLWMWGYNYYGQLGNGTYNNSSTPIKIMTGVKDVALGSNFTIVLKSDGSVFSFGNNSRGQLGQGSTFERSSTPTQIEISGVIDIEAGADFAAAINSFGDLTAWGYNAYGQVGNNSTSNQPDPAIVMRGVKQVSCGYMHSLALKFDGSLWSWGHNGYGEVGDHSTVQKNKPIEITLETKRPALQTTANRVVYNDVTWDDNYFNYDSSSYNKDLAVSGIILSEAAYSNQYVLEHLGYTILQNGMSNDSIDKPGYLIGYKVMYDFGETRVEIVMAIRGTKSILSADAITDVKSVSDGFNNATNYCYDRMKAARQQIAAELGNRGLSMSKKNTKYFIVGHSLGGACAGKLALRMANDGIAYTENIYCYTYAAPNYTNIEASLDSVVNVPGIFNIVNIDDVVPYVPSMMWYVRPVWGVSLYKAGKTYNFTTANNNSSFNSIIYDLFGEIPWDTYTPYKAHMTSTYYALLNASDYAIAQSYANDRRRVVSVHCPVDVEVYDKNGELCGYSKNTVVTYPNLSAVRITVIDDEKFIELPDNSYTVKYIGTDTGTMKVEDQIINVGSGEVVSEKVFEDVALEEGKQFKSTIDSENTEKTDLFVVDEDGDKLSTVGIDGTETELYTYDITEHNIQISTDSYKYDGTEKTQTVFIEGLTAGTDYRVIYDNNVNVGTATVTVKGINEYYGRESKTFKIYDEGECNDTVNWKLSPSGVLTITGSGAIPEYNSENPAPWSIHKAVITKIVINKGITSIGNEAFKDCAETTEIYIPATVTEIGSKAITGCTKLSSIVFSGSTEEWEAISFGESNTEFESIEKEFSSANSGHNWDDGVITKSATCNAEGEMTFTCNDCGATRTEAIEKLSHSYSKSETAPTCTGKGYTTYICSACGDTFVDDYVNAKGHNKVIDKAVPATFKSAGKTEGKHCSVCGEIIVAQKSVAKLGAAKLSKVTAGKKQFKAAWKSVKNTDGYQLQYSTDKSFKKGSKTVAVKGYKSTSKTVKKLKAKKKYYVRIRAYKKINGKTQYSSWSAKKTVTTKK